MLSDDAYLDGVKTSQAVRRPFGLLLLTGALAVGVYAIWIWLHYMPLDFMNVDPMLQASNEMLQNSYEIGFYLGSFFTMLAVIVIGNIIFALVCMLGGRGSRLLLRYSERLRQVEESRSH